MNSSVPPALSSTVSPSGEAGRWHAYLDLRVEQAQGASRLSRKRHQGPLYVQKPFYPEGPGLPHIYLLHPPGGLVSGDELRLNVELGPQAGLLLTTPGAGRVYRARGDALVQRQDSRLQLAANAHCEWFPQETIVYRGAHAELCTEVELAEGSRFLGWELCALGLPASAQPFDRGSLRQSLRISRGGLPLILERLVLDEATHGLLAAPVGWRAQPVNGLLLAGPFSARDDLAALLEALRALPVPGTAQALHGLSRLGDFVVARYLGPCAWQAKAWFTALWRLLRPALLGRPACPPRIWAT